MDTFELKDKDGTIYEVRAPSPELALAAFKKMQGMTTQPPAAPQVSPQRQSVDAWRKENPIKAGVRDVARNVVRGLPFGSYVDELAAGVNSWRRGTSYADEKRMIDEMDQASSDNSTKLGSLPGIGEVTAGGLTSLAAGVATAPLAPVARVMQGATLIPRAVNYGLSGLGYGALYGAGEGNTAGERASNAGTGAALGAILGGAAPVVGSAAGNTVRGVRDMTRPLPQGVRQFSRPAVNRMTEFAEMDNLQPKLVQQEFARLGDEGMIADLGPNMRTMTESLAQQPGPSQARVTGAMKWRDQFAPQRITNDVDGALGSPVNLPETIEATRKQYSQQAKPFYDTFRETEVPQSPQLSRIISQIERSVPGAFKKAQQMAVGDGVNPRYLARLEADPMAAMTGAGPRAIKGRRQWSPVELDYLKRSVDDAAQNAKPGSNEQRILKDLARNLRNTVDESISPGAPDQSPWAQGRAVAEEGFDVKKAVEEGRKAFNNNLSADQLAYNMKPMSAIEEASTRLGAREAMRSKMATAATNFGPNGDAVARRTLNSDENRRKLGMLANSPQGANQLINRIDAENTMAETYNQVMNGPATARRLAAQNIIPRQYNAAAGKELRGTSLTGAAAEAGSRLFNFLAARTLNERNSRIAMEMADMAVAQGARRDAIAQGLIEMAQRRGMSAAQRNQIIGFAQNLVRGSAPASISAATPPERGVLRGSQNGQGVR